MLQQLAYPLHQIVIEKALSELPHLALVKDLPDRRLDILCYHSSAKPVLLIECKAQPFTPQDEQQLIGYNHFVQASFIACASPEEVKTGWYDPALKNYSWKKGIPSYQESSHAN